MNKDPKSTKAKFKAGVFNISVETVTLFPPKVPIYDLPVLPVNLLFTFKVWKFVVFRFGLK